MSNQTFKKVIFTLLFAFAVTFISLNFAVASSTTDADSVSIATLDSSDNAADDFALKNDDDKDKDDEDEDDKSKEDK